MLYVIFLTSHFYDLIEARGENENERSIDVM